MFRFFVIMVFFVEFVFGACSPKQEAYMTGYNSGEGLKAKYQADPAGMLAAATGSCAGAARAYEEIQLVDKAKGITPKRYYSICGKGFDDYINGRQDKSLFNAQCR